MSRVPPAGPSRRLRLAPAARLVLAAGCLAAASGCAPRTVVEERVVERVVAAPLADPVADSAAVVAGVTAVLRQQEADWNAGRLRAFMDVYVRTRETTFLSGGVARRGWQDTYYAFERAYPDRAAMGTLTFSDLTVRPLAPGMALAWGRWRLARADDAPGGLFTLLLESRAGAWRIVHDHTSSE